MSQDVLPAVDPSTRDFAPPSGRGVLPVVAVAVACAGVALGVLVVATVFELPLLAPLIAAGILAIPLLLVRPVAFIVVATVVEVGNLSGVAATNGVPKLETALLGLAVLAVGLAWLRGEVRPASSPLVVAGLLYLAAQLLASLTGEDPTASLAVVAETAKALLWPVVVCLLLLTHRRAPVAMARAIVLTLAVLAALTVLQEFVLGNGSTLAGLSNVPVEAADIGGATARHSGPQGDPNFWGRVLLLGLPFALSLTHTATSRRGTVLWVCAALSIVGGVVLTGSRGTLLGAFVVFCVWALLTGGRAAKAVVLTPLVAGLVLLVPGVGSRLLTLSAFGADGLAVADPSLEGRVAAQRVALEMVVDHPVLGVGPGNFLALTPEYLQQLAIDSVPLAPHNQYLEATAEGGLVGFVAWLLLLGAAAFTASRARILARAGGPAVDAEAPLAMSNAVLAALVGWAVASVFLHLATFRTFLFVAALGAALDLRAARRQREFPAGDAPAPPSERSAGLSAGARSMAALLVAALLVLAGALWVRAEPPQASWSASAAMQMAVNYEQETDSPAYDLDTLSRDGLIRTMGGIAASQRFTDDGLAQVAAAGLPTTGITVEVSGSARSGLFVFTATGPDPEAAAAAADAVRASAQRFLDDVSSLYVTQSVPGPAVVTEAEPPYDRRVALVPLTLGALVAAGAGALAWRGRRAQDRPTPLRR